MARLRASRLRPGNRGALPERPEGETLSAEVPDPPQSGLLRLDDLADNNGRGWKRLTRTDLISLVYIALKLTPRRLRAAFHGRDAQKSDDACRSMAGEIADRLSGYPVFGPARPAPGPSVGGPGGAPSRDRVPVPRPAAQPPVDDAGAL